MDPSPATWNPDPDPAGAGTYWAPPPEVGHVDAAGPSVAPEPPHPAAAPAVADAAPWDPGASVPPTPRSLRRQERSGLPVRDTVWSPRTRPSPTLHQESRASWPVGLTLGITAAILLTAIVGVAVYKAVLTRPSRTTSVEDVVAPRGWEVHTSRTGAVAFAYDPAWVERRDRDNRAGVRRRLGRAPEVCARVRRRMDLRRVPDEPWDVG